MDNQVPDAPKSLHDPQVKQARMDLVREPHVAELTGFVNDLREKTGLAGHIPYFDPLDGGIMAPCLFLFEAQGRKAVESGFISRNNPDETAKTSSRSTKRPVCLGA